MSSETAVWFTVLGVAVAETTTVCGVVASFNCTTSGSVCGTVTCSDLRRESGRENYGLISAVGQVRERHDAVAGSRENSDACVVAGAVERNLHSGRHARRRGFAQ